MSHCGSSHEMRDLNVCKNANLSWFYFERPNKILSFSCGQAFHTHEDMSPQSGPKAIEMALGPPPPPPLPFIRPILYAL